MLALCRQNGIHCIHLVDTERRDRGIRGANYHVLQGTHMLAVLIENGFIIHRDEARLPLSDDWRNQIAETHLRAILEIEENEIV